MSRKKVLPALGAILLVVLPIVAHSSYAARPGVHLALDIAAAVLGVLGFVVAKPLLGGTGPAQ